MVLRRSQCVEKILLLKLGPVFRCFLESSAFSLPFMFVVILASIMCIVTQKGSVSAAGYIFETGAPNTFLLTIVDTSVYCTDNCNYAARNYPNLYISSKHTVPDVCMKTTGTLGVLNIPLGYHH